MRGGRDEAPPRALERLVGPDAVEVETCAALVAFHFSGDVFEEHGGILARRDLPAHGGETLAQLGANYHLGRGFIDSGGSGSIHAVGGLTALAVTWILGPRRGKYAPGGMPAAKLRMFALRAANQAEARR